MRLGQELPGVNLLSANYFFALGLAQIRPVSLAPVFIQSHSINEIEETRVAAEWRIFLVPKVEPFIALYVIEPGIENVEGIIKAPQVNEDERYIIRVDVKFA